MRRQSRTSAWVVTGFLVACSGSENRLGGTANKGSLSANGGAGACTGPRCSSATTTSDAGPVGAGGAAATDYPGGFGEPTASHAFSAGKWQGYIENYANFDHSDSVLLELDALSETEVAGKLVFGDATAPVPDYSDPHPYFAGGFGDPPNTGAPVDSYPFTLIEGKLTGSRLQFQIHNDEIWQPWCVQQTPVPDGVNAGYYACATNTTGLAADMNGCYAGMLGGPMLDCAQLALCIFGPCGCDATSCSVRNDGGANFDMSINGNRMDGSVAGLAGILNVHLTKL